ncbi:unnamed protein product [Acanthoscelides obtectus]|uniref:Uncharacterized protein n=1 Tax=Acanthoscelides obtectus TaxID=200917 RepID=A0A9P0MHR7_ACAOB|nr:unnamed protein product [Acanthoscelides obtectus]CAK1645597.1 hypothetical protein AOBTE_LOCUS14160 [Acanthoscelides obtectus]
MPPFWLTHQNAASANMSCKSQYSLPENYNPADHPPVKMRNHNCSDMSETQRKRRSRNRLSNRRSTGYVTGDVLEEALKMGSNPKKEDAERQQ